MDRSVSNGAEPLRLLSAAALPAESMSLTVVVKTAERRQDRRAARRQRKLDARTKALASEAKERPHVIKRPAVAVEQPPPPPQVAQLKQKVHRIPAAQLLDLVRKTETAMPVQSQVTLRPAFKVREGEPVVFKRQPTAPIAF